MSNWKEEFKKKFLQSSYCGDRECEHDSNHGEGKCFHGIESELIEFISQLRQNDRDELIKMLPTKWEEIGFSECMGIVKQLIQDYYNK